MDDDTDAVEGDAVVNHIESKNATESKAAGTDVNEQTA